MGAETEAESDPHRHSGELKERISDKSFNSADLFSDLVENSSNPKENALFDSLREIYDTEEKYCHDIGALIDGYLLPLLNTKRMVPCKTLRYLGKKTCDHNLPCHKCNKESESNSPILERADINSIFGNIRDIAKVNTALFTTIRSGLMTLNKSEVETSISVADIIDVYADAFKVVEPHLHIYSLYCSNHETSSECLARTEKDNLQFRSFLDARLQRGRDSKPLPGLKFLLSKPIGRLKSYSSLFSKLVAHSRPYVQVHIGSVLDSPESIARLTDMIQKLEGIHTIVREIEDRAHKRVKDTKALKISRRVSVDLGDRSLGPNIEAPWRRFMKRRDVEVIDKRLGLKPIPMTLYLFTDTLVFAKQKPEKPSRGQHLFSRFLPGNANEDATNSDSLPRSFGSSESQSNKRRTFGSHASDISVSSLRSLGSRISRRTWGSTGSGGRNAEINSGRKKTSDGGSNRVSFFRKRAKADNNNLSENEEAPYEVIEKMELFQINLKPLRREEDDSKFGFNILFKHRETYDKTIVDKTTGEEKTVQAVRTSIYRFDVYSKSMEKNEELFDAIRDQKQRLEKDAAEKEKATENFGVKKGGTRKWANRRSVMALGVEPQKPSGMER
uniref:DH domain-containing protein n=1 Tax=Aplanochytrium stocchinoi TaxID=215587 RepID=A0A7S3LS08_9STRA|mmetsp:Transcript_4848/g.6328  ORF Transcript_4848/g.6328 Transcript_4848/m.6328 type:complete len:615 (-) Transcript_4848:789-2633(-)|eukprot:CAMPEP_0204862806 /NCGR_PEP_ID=MMETSP1348-20121228/2818_1 /ASSEMBLY_ACC=CAM_ASM_000700 /TAXON_ID=215587 /ORGANISM="Aplanochytrium stocchinoi, Strain GSBS06" /LENGTH=614 /DNA_ID=CAMNT_0052012913 /DNA_START=108 /DNA_END=1952 /DNA_ORIENTATION=-